VRAILIGGGIGGLAAALALARRGVSVTVLEKSPVLGEAGAGLQLGPNATRVLFDLGLREGLVEKAFAPEAAEIRAASDQRLLFRNDLGATAVARWGAPYLQLHRADLQALLHEAVLAAGCDVRLGASVAHIDQDDAGVRVILSEGRAVEGDLAVGADGVRSRVRQHLFGAGAPRFTGQVAWRGMVPAASLPPGTVPPVAAVWAGPGRHFVHYYVRGGQAVNFVGVVECDWREESWTEPGDPADLQADFAGWPPVVTEICSAVPAPFRWALFDRPPLGTWTRGRVTLLGDAAHPMLPFLAQGAAMAIEDAAVLAHRLSAEPDVPRALMAYEEDRLGRTRRVQDASRFNARLFHLPQAIGRAAFTAAGLADSLHPAGTAARFDWLYGYKAP
jgi:salicylate hydroxylase